MTVVSATAPGKIILFGEHAVVYGQPAIAVPLPDVRARAVIKGIGPSRNLNIIAANLARTLVVYPELDPDNHALVLAVHLLADHLKVTLPPYQVLLHSTIPVASGLGSGAAVTTALLRTLSLAQETQLDNETLNTLVYEVEKRHHGTPSGIDNTVVVYEKPVYFVREESIQTFTSGHPLTLLVADTGLSSPTHHVVSDVRVQYEENPTRLDPIFTQIGVIANNARQAITAGDSVTLGALMNENHTLLCDLTVSCPELDHLVQAATSAGALGAKLSGSGRGGNLIALVTAETAQPVTAALLAAGAKRVLQTTLR